MAKSKKAPIAPNDPKRPDYEILSEVSGLDIPFSEDLDEANKNLKEGLLSAYSKNPYKLIVKCATSRKGNAKKALAQFMDEGKMNEQVLSFVTSRLWNRNPSGRQSVHKDVDASNPSSNAITYWDPEKCGVVPYMNARIGLVMKDYWKEKAVETADVSLDSLAEKGLELSSSMLFVKQQRNADTEIDLDRSDERGNVTEANFDTGTQMVADEAETTVKEGYGDEFHPDEKDIEIFVDKGEDPLTKQKERKRKIAKQDPLSPNRSDAAFLMALDSNKESPPLPDLPEARNEAIKSLALKTLIHYAEGHEEFQDIYELVHDEWNPHEAVLDAYAPDALDLIKDGMKNPEIRADRVSHDMQGELFGADLVANDSPAVSDPRRAYMTEEEVLKDDELNSKLWRMKMTSDELDSPERPDYIYLCNRLGEKPNMSIDSAQMYSEMVDMAKEYVENRIEEDLQDLNIGPVKEKLSLAIEDWNPANTSFTDCVVEINSSLQDQGYLERIEAEELKKDATFAAACLRQTDEYESIDNAAQHELFGVDDLPVDLPEERNSLESIDTEENNVRL